eukprot:6745668-Prymnesium_polylepis.1
MTSLINRGITNRNQSPCTGNLQRQAQRRPNEDFSAPGASCLDMASFLAVAIGAAHGQITSSYTLGSNTVSTGLLRQEASILWIKIARE